MPIQFPRQDIPESEKTPEWCSKHLDYAEQLFKSNNLNREKMSMDFASYNGVKPPNSMNYLTKTYGKANKAKFISYRAHVPKIQLRQGEFLSQPLAATVETINRDAKSAKMERSEFFKGAMAAREELMQLKEKAGVDIMQGAEIPTDENDPLWAAMSVKDKEEQIMQIALDEYIKFLDLKIKFSEDVMNGNIAAMMFSKTERDETGETRHITIDPRQAIYEEIHGDIFLEKSPILGSCIFITVHEALKRFKLTTEQKNLLYDVSQNPNNYLREYAGFIKVVNGNLLVAVLNIEWKSVIPTYYKWMPKTANQLAMSNIETEEDKYIIDQLDTKQYESNKAYYDKQEEKGKLKIVTKYREDLWEATRIGGIKELDVNCRRAYFQMRRVDDPTRIFGGSYTGYLCQTVDGKRISLYNEMENWSNIVDILMYKILSDVIKAKGKSLWFNLAALHKDSSVEKTLHELFNEGFGTYDTSAAGNMHGRDVSVNNLIQQYDIGLSDSFPSLISMLNVALDMMDRMTGINENRTGDIQASSTVSNTNSSIQASRTITAAFDYGTYLYISKVLTKIVESVKVTWAFYKVEKGEQILGSEKYGFLKASVELGYKDYGVHIQDGGKYNQVRQFMQGLMEASLNAKEMRPEDALKFMLEDTFVGQRAVLEDSWKKIKAIDQQAQQAQLQSQQQMQQAQMQQAIELKRAEIEDAQQQEADMIVLKGDTDIRVNAAKAQDTVVVNEHKSNTNYLNGENSFGA